MKLFEVVFLLCLLAVNLFEVDSAACTTADFDLSDGLTLNGDTVKLQKKNQNLTMTLKKAVECTLTVSAYKDMQFKMTLKTFALTDDSRCESQFFKAGTTATSEDIKVCEKAKSGASVTSTIKNIYLTIKSANPAGSIELTFESIQGSECGPSEITLTKPNQTITFPQNSAAFTKNSECDIVVKGIKNRDFTMNIPEINLFDGACNQDYIAASVYQFTNAEPQNKVCQSTNKYEPILVTNGLLYLKIKTESGQASAGVTLNFETLYPECGETNVKVPVEGKELQLPTTGQRFKSDTICNIKVSGTDGKDFKMTIPEIALADGDCKYDYITASTIENNLPNNTYKKCGNSPVTDPFESTQGAMYLQIKTKTVTADTKLKLKFESSASKHGKCALIAVLFFHLLSITPC